LDFTAQRATAHLWRDGVRRARGGRGLAARLDRLVICFVGHAGCLNRQRSIVAMERRLRLKVILPENRIDVSIRVYNERDYSGRIVGTTSINPDFNLIRRQTQTTAPPPR
jgi:thiamine pyrophosphate-dependent acetolactate synthase large subunit-like protein